MKFKLILIALCCILTCSIIPSSVIGDDNAFSSSARFYISLPMNNGNARYTNSQGYYVFGYFTNSYTITDDYIIINTFCEKQSYGEISDVREGLTVLIPKRIAPLIQEINSKEYSEHITPSDNTTNKE